MAQPEQVGFCLNADGQLTAATSSQLTVSDNCTWTGWWPGYWTTYSCPDKTGTAFKIAQRLMEKKIVNIKGDVEKFVKLVNMIAGEL